MRLEELRPVDLETNPVWEFDLGEGSDETAICPVADVPVGHLEGRFVGTRVVLVDGQQVWAILGNVTPDDHRLTQHFLMLSIERNGTWFHLARYHDHDYERNGPAALAVFLDREISSVFPISYDIRDVVAGGVALRGEIRAEPSERLSRSELIALAVP
ncbi:MAG TPA: hypothetical protein VMF52_12060 [Steroidobacteraceae bacterium]|nr:hypothetical protein [Steroidobacteraceae bacterium]